MSAGFRERIDILAPVITPDEGGGFALTFESDGEVAGRTESLSSRFERQAGRQELLDRRRFFIRGDVALTGRHRLHHDGRVYRITDLREEDDRGRYLIVTGVEVRGE